MGRLIKFDTNIKVENLKQFLDKRYNVLVKRQKGGLGDIFMHRMIFEDMKKLLPRATLTFACPEQYHPAVIDHPFIDRVVDSGSADENDYGVHYNTSWICSDYELEHAPFNKKHRADIWADYCGVSLKTHNMNFVISEQEKDDINKVLKENNINRPFVVVCPVTAMVSKNLDPHQILPVCERLKKLGFSVAFLHNRDLPEYGRTLHFLNTRQFMALISVADMVVAADTAALHCAGGMGRPTVGVFGWADGKVYGKYYENFFLVQKHREDDPEWQCGPCYNLNICPKCEVTKFRKPCITEINADFIWGGVDKCLSAIKI